MKKSVIAANWKMNFLPDEAAEFIERLSDLTKNTKSSAQIHLYVPYIDLKTALEKARDTGFIIGAQNCHYEEKGAFTGEISFTMLCGMGVRNVMVGHSERRKYFGETDTDVNKKIIRTLNMGMSVILCVGENLMQHENGTTYRDVEIQLRAALKGVPEELINHVKIAYEPVWAIGTGKTAAPSQANSVCGNVRSVICNLYGKDTSEKMYVLYGGSVSSQNAAEILCQSDIDGLLIGGASLDVKVFYEIIDLAADL
jgi:triosephosphate isomerase